MLVQLEKKEFKYSEYISDYKWSTVQIYLYF